MNEQLKGLRLLGDPPLPAELRLVEEVFHRINKILPDTQEMLEFPPEMPARDAVAKLLRLHYTQAPVVQSGRVVGMFSLRSFAHEAASGGREHWSQLKCAPGDLPVEEFLEQQPFVSINDELKTVFDLLDKHDAALVGSEERIVGILTPMDVVGYLYRVASPFVLISEIELALRGLVRSVLDEESIRNCLLCALVNTNNNPPENLENTTFDQLLSLVCHGDNWTNHFATLGGNRALFRARLVRVRDIRNDLFHFKRGATVEDHQYLSEVRDWILARVKRIENKTTGGVA
jgi:predicted transcriptional regulator